MIQILCLHNHVEDFVPLSFMDSSDPQGMYQIVLCIIPAARFFDNKLCVRHNSA